VSGLILQVVKSNISPSESFCDSTERRMQHVQLQCKVKGADSIIFPTGRSFESLRAVLDDAWLVFTTTRMGQQGLGTGL